MPTLRDLGEYQGQFEPGAAIGPQGRPLTRDEQEQLDALLRQRPIEATPIERMPRAPQQQLPSWMRPQSQAAPVTLASMGQRYQNYPPATFDQRFGPFQAPPGPVIEKPDQEQIRRLFELQLLRQTPESIVPGTRTFPFGYTQI